MMTRFIFFSVVTVSTLTVLEKKKRKRKKKKENGKKLTNIDDIVGYNFKRVYSKDVCI